MPIKKTIYNSHNNNNNKNNKYKMIVIIYKIHNFIMILVTINKMNKNKLINNKIMVNTNK